jgi:NAD(P)-dependent dehydrogenase (short-subunit alcohol dehydrogenase family)
MPAVLITGASRGIGRATTLHLADLGWDVYAGVRSQVDGDELAASAPEHITPVELDVTNRMHIAALDATLPPRLDAVVNNAGIVLGGALETVPIDELRRQLEVNVVAQVAVTQAVLPRIRQARGRVVFISSISGMVASPMLGAYAASKFALEAVGDALRMELRPWGISVAIIEPGQIDTDVWRNAPETLEAAVRAMSEQHRTLYSNHIAGTRKAVPRAQKLASPVGGVAKAIEKALTDPRPKARYVAGRGARTSAVIGRFAPRPVRDAVVGMTSGVPRSAPSS